LLGNLTHIVWWASLLVVLFSLSCSKERPADVGPEDAVTAFFGAVADRECTAASRWLSGDAKARFEQEPCQEALEALARKRFDRVLSSSVDGRDPELVLVRASFADERAPVIIGVRKTSKGHRIVSF